MKGSVGRVQKRLPTLVTEVWEWLPKTDESISDNRFKQIIQFAHNFMVHTFMAHTFMTWYSFKVSYLLWQILKILDNGRNRNLEIFYSFFFFFDSQRYHYWIVKSTEYIFKEFSKDIPTWLDNQVKLSAIMDIFWDFLIFYWILFSPQVKRLVVISNKLIYICCITSCRKIFGN